jgi:hypothetical protein
MASSCALRGTLEQQRKQTQGHANAEESARNDTH